MKTWWRCSIGCSRPPSDGEAASRQTAIEGLAREVEGLLGLEDRGDALADLSAVASRHLGRPDPDASLQWANFAHRL